MTVFRGQARRLIQGRDDTPVTCQGPGSIACRSNAELNIECGAGICDNRVIQRRAFKRTYVRQRTLGGIRQWGLFMAEAGWKGDKVEEYVGEGLTREDFEARREKLLAKGGTNRHWYFVELANGVVLDATYMGNYSRFANHSCKPTGSLEPWSVGAGRRLILTLTCDVPRDGEVTLSYGFVAGDVDQACECGMDGCVGTIARLPPPAQGPARAEGASVADTQPSPPTPAKKQGRSERSPVALEQGDVEVPVREEGAEDTDSDSGGEGPSTGRGVKVEAGMPSEEQVCAAMLEVERQFQEVEGGTREAKQVWKELRAQLLSGKAEDKAKALSSPHADNVRAFLCEKGEPFVLCSPISFTDPPVSPPQHDDDDDREEVIDLTDSPPNPRLDARATSRGVSAERPGRESSPGPVAGSQGVGSA
mmetsp:Transcript_18283/g.37057  ORF Transcript_18283/g.37057 Transcript_18283/m.37057 type:complete len:420 (+) Transcript_18283:848-2107(+)